jgi:hypothetical protein
MKTDHLIAYACSAGLLIIAFLFGREFQRRSDLERNYPISASATPPAPAAIPGPRPEPRTKNMTISLMPGQTTDLINREFRIVEIHSQFPLRILNANCQEDYAVEFFCRGDPADIFLTDRRLPPILRTPEANTITVTLTEF